MTHEEIVKEIVNKATTALFIEGIIEKDEIEQVLSIITIALTTYRTQVLEEMEKEIEHAINVREYKLIKHNEPMSIETITIPANQEQAYNLARTVTLKDVLDIVKSKHPTN